MRPRPRFAGRLGAADVATSVNAGLGFAAVAGATVSVSLAARILLLAAIVDAIDGLLARRYGGTPVGESLDSLADVASFGVAPAALVFGAVADANPVESPVVLASVVAGSLFVAAAVVRLGLYTAYDTGRAETRGVQTTLAGTILAAALLAGATPLVLLAALTAFVALMVSRIPYPDLRPAHALSMGVVQALALLAPDIAGHAFPRVLLAFALAYLVLAPRFYPRTEGKP
ncbi:protein sorting system archaetidylserine synthase [Salarchaeum sp. JOR-1]|uniref:protein sorting system archaetidylserine synthase n=1 Tax=Salarchaeum sp. JOR-1 TaxID=2599399 RepID=UPI00119844DA|nr:protein sorting system archaetidylserine synthase [Salarchaeum sp. JOR-1]QDX41311.1 phosphatidylcholine/phosphatidylserine synthase [Salarchaeum sp. JOR-1]